LVTAADSHGNIAAVATKTLFYAPVVYQIVLWDMERRCMTRVIPATHVCASMGWLGKEDLIFGLLSNAPEPKVEVQVVSTVSGELKYSFDPGDDNYDSPTIVWCDWRNWFLFAYFDGRVKLYEYKQITPIVSWRFPDDMICHVGFDGVHLIFCGYNKIYIIDFLQLKTQRGRREVLHGRCA